MEGAPNPAIATQTETFGLGLGAGSADPHLALGWNRHTRIAVPNDTALSIKWPTSQLFDVRLGTQPPFLPPAPPEPQATTPLCPSDSSAPASK